MRKALKYGVALIVIAFSTYLIGGEMGLFSKPKDDHVLFSEMNGVITYKGEPVKHAKIKRYIATEEDWDGTKGDIDYFETNEKGEFHIPTKMGYVKTGMFAPFMVSQALDVIYEDKEFEVWVGSKRFSYLNAELGANIIGARCELTDEIQRIEALHGVGDFSTRLQWEKLEEVEESKYFREHGEP